MICPLWLYSANPVTTTAKMHELLAKLLEHHPVAKKQAHR